MGGSKTLDATMDELEEIAVSRTLATGTPVVVAAFTGSDRARVMDVDLEHAEVVAEDHGLVPLMHPSPSVADRPE